MTTLTRRCFLGAASLITALPVLGQQRKSPDFTFTLPGGKKASLSQYFGKPIMLTFVDTTCSHCQEVTTILRGIQARNGAKLQVIEVAFNEEAPQEVPKFIREYKVNFPMGWAERDSVFAYLQRSIMQRTFFPMMALINSKGMIVSQHYGDDPMFAHGAEADNLRKAAAELMKQ